MSESKLFKTLDEQNLVSFTGKIHVQERTTRQLLGELLLREGQVLAARHRGTTGFKAFINVLIEEAQLVPMELVVEPEIIEERHRQIHLPYSVLKTRSLQVLERFQKVAHLKPPAHLKLIPRASFLAQGEDVTEAEFSLLCTLSEWNLVEEVYRHCPLQDFEITEALVGLRRKEALQVVAPRTRNGADL